ncbi:MAG: hypothetical protein JXB13_19655 [Phycisphaerae bacterium]|nr:hypothetical protein [Phycisphaerae bacterium]
MFERIGNGWELAKSSYRCLLLDKELLVFPLLSGLACLIVLASFTLPLMSSDYVQTIEEDGQAPSDPMAYVILFLFYFCNYFVIVFFNAGLIACAVIRFNGGDPTVGDGFRAATARLPQILAWAFVSATVGVILKAIESRSSRAGRIASGLLGMAWGAGTYFVVPVLVMEKLGPFAAVKRSLSILRRTWGEALVSNFGIGLFVFLMILGCLVPAVLGVLVGSRIAIVAGIAVTVVLIILVSLISSALSGIVLGALYLYAAEERVPPQFEAASFRGAFVQR